MWPMLNKHMQKRTNTASTFRSKDNTVPKNGTGRGPFTPNFLNTPKCHVANLEQMNNDRFTAYYCRRNGMMQVTLLWRTLVSSP